MGNSKLLEKLAPLEEKMLAIAREREGYLEQHGTGKGTWYSVGR